MTSIRNAFDFTKRVVIVTGGSAGIGRATAILFAEHGANVVVADVNEDGSETAEMIKREGGNASFVKTDVSDPRQVRNMVAGAVKRYGGLDYAFNNAGVLSDGPPLDQTDEAAFDRVMGVDARGVFLCMKYELQHMLQAGGGAIVNNASIAGMIAEPGISAYVAAKHAVIGLTKAAALEYATKGIRINALAPGLVETGMTKHWFDNSEMCTHLLANSPMGRPARAEEIAGMVLFLCSDYASFATGQTYVIDGGYTAR